MEPKQEDKFSGIKPEVPRNRAERRAQQRSNRLFLKAQQKRYLKWREKTMIEDKND